jgi:putative Holliday junction resolvase
MSDNYFSGFGAKCNAPWETPNFNLQRKFKFQSAWTAFGRDQGRGFGDYARMRILALDHGTRRIGVALSDELQMIAQPLEYIAAEPFADFLGRLKELLQSKQVEMILVGLPRNMDGSYGPAAAKVEAFVAVLRGALAIPIKTWDERLTTVQATRLLVAGKVPRDKRKEKVDKMAAAILLQSYLDSFEVKRPGSSPNP